MSHIAVSTHERHTVRHNVVVDHDPPISVQDGKRKVQIERTVFSSGQVEVGDPISDYLNRTHFAHNVKADGSLGAERKNYWLSSYDSPEAHARLKEIEADALARIKTAHEAWLRQNKKDV